MPEPLHLLTVSQVAAKVDVALRDGLPAQLRVVGEVSGVRERTHWYFDLKDENAVVSCVLFAFAARKLGFTPAPGQQVVATGRVEFYAKAGKVSFVVEKLEPVGAGALDLRLRQLVEECRALGWLDAERKRPLPVFPRRIAVITSRSGAALQDVLDTIRRRCPSVGVALVDVRVQGDAAAPEIARAVRLVGRFHHRFGIDAILLTRGGGSKEDLWCFNERVVAEAIVVSPVPVVAAIGHETDTTLAELVADERAATPTQAAMRLTPDSAALQRQLDALDRRLALGLERGLDDARQSLQSLTRDLSRAWRHRAMLARRGLDAAAAGIDRNRPAARLAAMRARLETAARQLASASNARVNEVDVDVALARLRRAINQRVAASQTAVESAEKHLRVVNPLAVLERGYSVTTRVDGTIVRRASDVLLGETLSTRLAHGRLTSIVHAARPDGAAHDQGPHKFQASSGPAAERSGPAIAATVGVLGAPPPSAATPPAAATPLSDSGSASPPSSPGRGVVSESPGSHTEPASEPAHAERGVKGKQIGLFS
ncbi:MAG: exodeoxyribonuclease VII large subunit [Planctomycetota bacterium]|nr:exodeoxyribonuclease VII large subunit [Planctomycetota bacterium]